MFTFLLIACYILLAHTVSDFCLQSDWMAKNKSNSNKVLFLHVWAYMLGMFGLLIIPGFFGVLTTDRIPLFILVNGLAHFITDYVTSRITSHYWKKENRHAFFVTIGFDQLAHNIVLLLTTYWLFLS